MWWPRRKQAFTQDDFGVLARNVHAQGLRLKELEEKHLALEAAHERLRGRFYATRPQEKPEPTSKAEILREFGFVPGRPVPHK